MLQAAVVELGSQCFLGQAGFGMQFLEEFAHLVREAAKEGNSQQAWDPHRYHSDSHALDQELC